MNERKMNLGKIAMVGGMIAMTAMLSAIMMTGCGCQQRTEKTVSTADSAATADSAPKPTYSEEEQAVLDENLSIDASGNVVDCSGKQLKVDDDGKVEVKKSDGTVIKVDADTVRKTIEKQKTEDSGSSVAPTQLQQSASSQQQTATEPKTNPAVQPTNPKPTTPKATEPKPTSTQPTEKAQPTTADPHAGKTYHEAEYEYIQHSAETERAVRTWVTTKCRTKKEMSICISIFSTESPMGTTAAMSPFKLVRKLSMFPKKAIMRQKSSKRLGRKRN